MVQDESASPSDTQEPSPRSKRLVKVVGLLGVSALVAAASLFLWNRQTNLSEQAYLSHAQTALQSGQLSAAVIEFKNALRANPSNTQTRLDLAHLYLKLGMGLQAEEQLNRSRKLGSEERQVALPLAEALILQNKFEKVLQEINLADYPGAAERQQANRLRADALLGLGKSAEACPQYQQLHDADNNFVPAYWGLARCAVLDKNYDDAKAHLATALKLEPRNILSYLLQGQVAQTMGDQPGAEAAFGHALDLDPDNIAVRLARAEVRLAAGKPDLAAEDVKAAKAKAPDLVMVRYTDALVAYFQGRLRDAQNILLELTAKVPDHVPSRVLSGYVAYKLEEYHRADSDLSAAILSRPQDRTLHLTLAQVRLKSAQPEGALQALQSLLSADPQDVEVLTAASDAYLQMGNSAKAAEYLEKVSALATENPVLRAKLGLWRLQSGDLPGAVRELESAARQGTQPQQVEAWRIMSHLMRKQYDAALAMADQLEQQFPKDASVQYLKGMAYLGKGDTAEARRSFEHALAIKPTDMAAARSLAQLDVREGKPAEARARFEAILKQDPKHYEAMMELAMLAQSERRESDLVAWLTRAADAARGETAPRLFLARYYLARNEPEKALSWARQAFDLNTRNPKAMETLGDAQYAAGDKASAAYTYLQWTILDLHSPQAFLKRGKAQLELGQNLAARESLERVLSLQPDQADAVLALAVLDLKEGRFQAAQNLARKMQKLQPKLWQGYALEAESLAGLGRHAEAAKAFAQAFALRPAGDLAIRLHQALTRAGQVEQARQIMVQWLQKSPGDLGAHLYFGGSLLQAGSPSEAVAEYQAVLKAAPDNLPALVGMARALHAQRDPRAVGYAEQAYDKGGRNADLSELLGWILFEQGKTRRGLDMLRKAESLQPDSPDIRYHLAMALAKTGEREQARLLLEVLLAKGGEFPQRAQAQALLKSLPVPIKQ